jgi:hypothetical protein
MSYIFVRKSFEELENIRKLGKPLIDKEENVRILKPNQTLGTIKFKRIIDYHE